MATYVFVAGGGSSGSVWKPVVTRLQAQRHNVFTPTLTGIGERAHLASPQVDLDTHIEDIVSVLEFEDLYDVFLVGHCVGGVVATGVAQRVPHRLARLIYLDAFVPLDGQSALDIAGPQWRAVFEERVKTLGDGWRVPALPEVMAMAGPSAKVTPHPFKAFSQPVSLKNPAAMEVPRSFIYCTESGWGSDIIAQMAARAQADGWDYHELASGHMAMCTAPKELVALLLEIVEGPSFHG